MAELSRAQLLLSEVKPGVFLSGDELEAVRAELDDLLSYQRLARTLLNKVSPGSSSTIAALAPHRAEGDDSGDLSIEEQLSEEERLNAEAWLGRLYDKRVCFYSISNSEIPAVGRDNSSSPTPQGNAGADGEEKSSATERNPDTQGGALCIAGTRFPVSGILKAVASWPDQSLREVAAHFHSIDVEKWRAALNEAAELIDAPHGRCNVRDLDDPMEACSEPLPCSDHPAARSEELSLAKDEIEAIKDEHAEVMATADMEIDRLQQENIALKAQAVNEAAPQCLTCNRAGEAVPDGLRDEARLRGHRWWCPACGHAICRYAAQLETPFPNNPPSLAAVPESATEGRSEITQPFDLMAELKKRLADKEALRASSPQEEANGAATDGAGEPADRAHPAVLRVPAPSAEDGSRLETVLRAGEVLHRSDLERVSSAQPGADGGAAEAVGGEGRGGQGGSREVAHQENEHVQRSDEPVRSAHGGGGEEASAGAGLHGGPDVRSERHDVPPAQAEEEGAGAPAGEVAHQLSEDEQLYVAAVAALAGLKFVSASLLQRKLHTSYNQTAPLLERMEREGLVGPKEGDKPREVLIGNKMEKPAVVASAVQSLEDRAKSPVDRIPAGTGDSVGGDGSGTPEHVEDPHKGSPQDLAPNAITSSVAPAVPNTGHSYSQQDLRADGKQVAGTDEIRSCSQDFAVETSHREEDRPVAPVGRRDSSEGGPPTPEAAANALRIPVLPETFSESVKAAWLEFEVATEDGIERIVHRSKDGVRAACAAPLPTKARLVEQPGAEHELCADCADSGAISHSELMRWAHAKPLEVEHEEVDPQHEGAHEQRLPTVTVNKAEGDIAPAASIEAEPLAKLDATGNAANEELRHPILIFETSTERKGNTDQMGERGDGLPASAAEPQEQSIEKTALQGNDSGGSVSEVPEGTPAPHSKLRWGHNANGSAWHLWARTVNGSITDGEWTQVAQCGEEVKGALLYAAKPIADAACITCAAIIGWDEPDLLSRIDPEPVVEPPPEKPAKKKRAPRKVKCGGDKCTETKEKEHHDPTSCPRFKKASEAANGQ